MPERQVEVAPRTMPPPEPLANDEITQAVLATTHGYCKANVSAAKIDAERRIPPRVLKELGALGLLGLTLPESHGGAQLPALVATRVVTALAEHDRSVATTIGLHLGLGTRGLVAFGTAQAKDEFLPRLASGEHLAAFATTESGAGSDLSAIASTGQLDGAVLRVNGQKIYVTNGALASVVTTTVSTPGLNGAARGLSVVSFSAQAPGVTVLGEEHKLGLKGSSTTTLCYDDVQVPLAHVLGVPGQGAEQLAHILSWGRLLLSAGCVGTARVALRRTVEHVQQRKQFGRVLAAQDVVRQQLGKMGTRLFAMRALVEAAARIENDYEQLARLTSSAKVLCSEGAWHVCDTAIQLHGGAGYIEETGLALLLRDARVTRIFEGANDVLATHLGLMELARPWSVEQATTPMGARVEQLRAELVARHGGLRVMGRKVDQHRLGRACVWRDAAEAAAALAKLEPSRENEAWSAAVIREAQDEIEHAAREPAALTTYPLNELLTERLP